VRHISVCYCIEISVGGSVALVLECDILLFVSLLLQYIVDLTNCLNIKTRQNKN
jgi:hypothetical protein